MDRPMDEGRKNVRALNAGAALKYRSEGTLDMAVRFIGHSQICDVGLWQKCVKVFFDRKDGDGRWSTSWRSEYWGKMMRGASMVVKYTNDDGMYSILEASARELLLAADEDGRISGYSKEKEFTRWDIWGRKYVLLGFMYFLEICRDASLKDDIIEAMRRHADYIVSHIGGERGPDIRTCSEHWEGMNSCSVLEPMVRLYELTGEQRYLDFSEYIISTGFILSANLIELAYEDRLSPHEYPVVKAYEMMSCFEGLLRYYYVVGDEKHRTALINFGRRIMEGELSIIGCSGCTHELFDHTAVRQTQTDYDGVIQETCVTVTWMKFAAAMLELTGSAEYADRIEQSYYNAYLGSLNLYRVPTYGQGERDLPQVLPFDSYSPLVSDVRGKKVGGYNAFSDDTFYGCCACIGAAGAGVVPNIALMKRGGGLILNFYEKGAFEALTPSGENLKLTVYGEYPYGGRISVALSLGSSERFELSFRIPAWCDGATVTFKEKTVNAEKGYFTLLETWEDGDEVMIDLPMRVKRVLPPEGAVNADIFASYTYGPVVLAADKRMTDPDKTLDIAVDTDGYAASRKVYCPEIREARLCLELSLTDGERVRLIDYASSGKTWSEESRCAAWLYRRSDR